MKSALNIFVIFLSVCGTAQQPQWDQDCLKIVLSNNQIFIKASNANQQDFIVDLGRSGSARINPVSDCDQKSPQLHIGRDFLSKCKQSYMLDFDISTICRDILTEEISDFQDVGAVFRSDGIYIPIMLRWKTYLVKFDTGYIGTIAMTRKDAAPFIKESCKTYQTVAGKYSVYPNKWVTITGNYYNAAITVNDNGVSKMGMGFLKGFNWILDFRTRKVYARKNSIGLDAENAFPPDLEVDAINGKLVVVSKVGQDEKIKPGATVFAVGNQNVTADNMCALKALINGASNLNNLNLEISKEE